ncbi:MAG: hypothetical protein KAU31_17685 [Spirochaetaceae bacterium]|nr:hypothetical protein [Spirochaetaceae bacterium]
MHTDNHIAMISQDRKLWDMACLAAGGAVLAYEIALKGEPVFACIAPPGHHASRNSAWGYCAFCNMGVALLRLLYQRRIRSAFILDFDAHKGDGTIDVLSGEEDIRILNPMAENREDYLAAIRDYISTLPHVDIVAVSAGFDTYEKDVGKKLKTLDFYLMGRLMKKLAGKMGHGRRFAILEGGYYQPDLGKNVLAFCQGFE